MNGIAPEIRTIPGTDSGSTYIVLGETDKAVFAVKPEVAVQRHIPKYGPALFFGGRLRVQSKEPEAFASADAFIADGQKAFQTPELRRKSNSHGSTDFVSRVCSANTSGKDVHEAVAATGALAFVANSLLAKVQGEGVTPTITAEQLATIYEEKFNDTVPNVAPPLPEQRLLIGNSLFLAEGEKKPVPQYGMDEPDLPSYESGGEGDEKGDDNIPY